MPLLPKPFPDEVIGSVLARGFYQSHLPRPRFLSSVFADERLEGASFLMGTDVRRVAAMAGVTPLELVMKHSMLPYTLAFVSQDHRQELIAKAAAPGRTSKRITGLTKNTSYGVPYLRRCNECMREDLLAYGETYWRRSHLLPGVLWCHAHGMQLQAATQKLKGGSTTNVFCMPHHAKPGPPPTSRPQRPIEALIAEVSLQAINGEIPARSDWGEVYRSQALGLGYKLPQGFVASKLLASDIVEVIGADLLRETDYQFSASSLNSWPMVMLRAGYDGHFAPTKHVFMQAFMKAQRMVPTRSVAFYERTGPVRRDYAQYDKELAPKLSALIETLASKGGRVTTRWLLEQLGARQVYRHHSAEMPRTCEVLLGFKVSEFSKKLHSLKNGDGATIFPAVQSSSCSSSSSSSSSSKRVSSSACES